MVQLLNYSVNTVEQPLLQQLESCLQSFSFSQKAALAITAIFEAVEPPEIYFDYGCNQSIELGKAVELLLQLSNCSKLFVARAITEELAVLEHLRSSSCKGDSNGS